MLKLVSTGGTLTASTAIPLTVKYSTNNSVTYSNNAITISKPGYYEIIGSFVVEATATGENSIQLYANGTAIPEAKAITTYEAIGDIQTFTIVDNERVVRLLTNTENVTLTFVPENACTLISADVQIFAIK